MTHTLVGVFDDYRRAQAALNDLRANGFAIEHIDLNPNDESFEARRQALNIDENRAPAGIRGFFHSLFGSPAQDRHGALYSEAVRRGSFILSVRADSESQVTLANQVLARHDPVDIDDRAAIWTSRGWSAHDRSAAAFSDDEVRRERESYVTPDSPAATGGRTSAPSMAQPTPGMTEQPGRASPADERAIPVIQEDLQVGKREVQRGGVRIFQHVTQTPVQETVHLREEHVSVERHPVNEPATPADLEALKEGSFEMRERAEEAVVAKTARVVEEVVVGKVVTEHDETITDSVRRSDVEVERIPGETAGVGISAATDEGIYRSHWTTQYGPLGGKYEDYAPAYQYGARLAADERYRQHRYSDVEPDLEREWTSTHAGHPWEKFKDAVRYGWERVTR